MTKNDTPSIETAERIIADGWQGMQARHAAEAEAFVAWTRSFRREAYTKAMEDQTHE